jgi:hypothetical protein
MITDFLHRQSEATRARLHVKTPKHGMRPLKHLDTVGLPHDALRRPYLQRSLLSQ